MAPALVRVRTGNGSIATVPDTHPHVRSGQYREVPSDRARREAADEALGLPDPFTPDPNAVPDHTPGNTGGPDNLAGDGGPHDPPGRPDRDVLTSDEDTHHQRGELVADPESQED